MTEILAFNVVEKSQKIDKPKISIDESIKKQKIIGLKTDFIGLNEVFEQIKDIKDLKQNGFVNKDEFFMTSAQLEAKKQQIINKINNNISSDEVAKQELVNIVKDLLIPEWYEIPLIALPITQEGIVLTKSVKLIKAIERFEKNYDKIKLLFKNDNFFKTIENLIAKLKETFDTKNLEYLINGLRKDSNKILNTQKQRENATKLANELEKLKNEVDAIKKEKIIIKEVEKPTKIEVKTIEKGVEKLDVLSYRQIESEIEQKFFSKIDKKKFREICNDAIAKMEKNLEYHYKNNSKPDMIDKNTKRFLDLFSEKSKEVFGNRVDFKTLEELKNFKNSIY